MHVLGGTVVTSGHRVVNSGQQWSTVVNQWSTGGRQLCRVELTRDLLGQSKIALDRFLGERHIGM